MYGFFVMVEVMFMYYDKCVFLEDDIKIFFGIMFKGKFGINFVEVGVDYCEIFWFIVNGIYFYGENGEDFYGIIFNILEGV